MSNKRVIDVLLNQYSAYEAALEHALKGKNDKVIYRVERLLCDRKNRLRQYRDELQQLYPENTIFSGK